jgi:uncharacterized protein (TIGR00251 family)
MDIYLALIKANHHEGLTVDLTVKVIPKSSKSEFQGLMGENILKIKLKAVPENNKANIELLKFLSQQLDINIEKIKIVSGSTSTRKHLRINP